MTAVMNIMELFHPLDHFGVVQEPALNQLVNINIFLDSVLSESIVEYFVVVHVLIIKLCLPFDSSKIECAWIDLVDDLAVDCTCS